MRALSILLPGSAGRLLHQGILSQSHGEELLQSGRRGGCVRKLGLDEAAADRVACEVDTVAHAELAEDVGAVAFDRFDAKNEGCRDLLRAVSFGYQLEHLELAWR